MENKKILNSVFVLSVGGVLFSGYLSAKKLVTGVCAFNESCPYFLGYPACWYGFGMFSLMFIISLLAVLKSISHKGAFRSIEIISALGILFAGWLSIGEIVDWYSLGRNLGYGLVLPTCVYGLVFYVIIFILSLIGIYKLDGNK